MEFDRSGFERGSFFADRRVEFFEIANEALELAEAVEDAIFAVESGDRGGGGFHETAGIVGAPPAVLEILFFGGIELGGVNFADLVFEQIDFVFGGILRIAKFLECRVFRAPCTVGFAISGELVF